MEDSNLSTTVERCVQQPKKYACCQKIARFDGTRSYRIDLAPCPFELQVIIAIHSRADLTRRVPGTVRLKNQFSVTEPRLDAFKSASTLSMTRLLKLSAFRRVSSQVQFQTRPRAVVLSGTTSFLRHVVHLTRDSWTKPKENRNMTPKVSSLYQPINTPHRFSCDFSLTTLLTDFPAGSTLHSFIHAWRSVRSVEASFCCSS